VCFIFYLYGSPCCCVYGPFCLIQINGWNYTWLTVADGQHDGIVIAGVLQTTTAILSAVLLAHARQMELTGGHTPRPVDAGYDVNAVIGVILEQLRGVEVPPDCCTNIRFALEYDRPRSDTLVS